jgi:hypothetical protein
MHCIVCLNSFGGYLLVGQKQNENCKGAFYVKKYIYILEEEMDHVA